MSWSNRHGDAEDMIDFPCSVTYAGAYAEQELTPDFPTGYYAGPRARSDTSDLREQNQQLKAELELARRGVPLTESIDQTRRIEHAARQREHRIMQVRDRQLPRPPRRTAKAPRREPAGSGVQNYEGVSFE